MSTKNQNMRIQRGLETLLNIRQVRLTGGEKPLGWKVGFGAPAAMERLEIDAPLVGFLTDETLVPSNETVAITGWTRAIAEPEIVVYMSVDLPAGADRDTARAAIAAIGPAIELADVHFPPDDITSILAGNVYHRHLILGKKDTSRAGCMLDGCTGRVYHNGELIAETTDFQANTGDTINIVRHIADTLPAYGEQLRAGEIIITGSIVPPVSISGGDNVRFTLDPVDTVAINLVA